MIPSIRFVISGLVWFLLLLPVTLQAQVVYTITGQVKEAANNAGVPFASLSIKGRTVGTTADAEGRFQLKTTQIGDSLLVTSLGFRTKAVALTREPVQTLTIALESAENRLQEVRVYGKGGDPAYRVLRAALTRRNEFNPEQLSAFQYESYTKVEAYINNVEKKTRTKRNGETVVRRKGPIGKVLNRLPAITDESGQPAVPVFITENHSEYYQRNQPDRTKEKILKTQIKAVGIQEGGLLSQFTGASFQQYNFYQNYVRVLRKDIPSPLGEAWEALYKVQMMDTVAVGDQICYEIDFEPKRATDLAFVGTAWLDTNRLGLVQIETRIDRRANINFIDEIRVGQELETLPGGARLPVRTEVRIDTDELTPNAPGALVRFFASARNIVINQPQPLSFYSPALELADDYRDVPKGYWQAARPDSISADELRAFRVVDSVRNVPIVKVTGEAIRLFANGYQPIGKVNVDVGPLLYTYANNDIEGNRFRVGLRTNSYFSRRWTLSGYLAYGTRDERFKYAIGADYILKRKPWTVVGFRHSYDLERLGVSSENIGTNYLFLAYSRFGIIRRPYLQEQSSAYIRRELGKGFTQTVTLRERSFNPLFPFAYYANPDNPADESIRSQFRTAEMVFETRFAPDEVVVQSDNERLSFGATRKPELTFRYTLGLHNSSASYVTYGRFQLEMKHSFRMGVLGRTSYTLGAGLIPSRVPYPLLFIPLGNETSFYVYNAYNLMNFFEFATDRYASAHVEHNFEGLFFNRIPAIKRLKWRTLVTGRIMAGGIRPENVRLVAPVNDLGQPVTGFQSLGKVPYIELGYGIDNIFKLFRVDATHRLTYRDNPGVTPFAIKVSAWVGL